MAARDCVDAARPGMSPPSSRQPQFHFGLLESPDQVHTMRVIRLLWDSTEAYAPMYYNSPQERREALDGHDRSSTHSPGCRRCLVRARRSSRTERSPCSRGFWPGGSGRRVRLKRARAAVGPLRRTLTSALRPSARSIGSAPVGISGIVYAPLWNGSGCVRRSREIAPILNSHGFIETNLPLSA